MSDTIDLSRISKLLVDRDGIAPDRALEQRQRFGVRLVLGFDVASSASLQLAALTAAALAHRCFPGGVRVACAPDVLAAVSLVPHARATLGQALGELLGDGYEVDLGEHATVRVLVFGDADADGLRVTFDGWTAMVGPVEMLARMAERPLCSLAPVLAASVAVSEVFLGFADVALMAGRRAVGLSLWRPDLDPRSPDALGVPVEFLPESLWMLGLGHLGNAYAWALAALPYEAPGDVIVYLNDFDRVEAANTETGVLFGSSDIARLKTRTVADWLELRGFQTRMVERPFDENFRRRNDEPGLALCGFDKNLVRLALPSAGFRRVVETGLGGLPSNFDAIGLHTLPNRRRAEELWPVGNAAGEIALAELHVKRARENPGYARLAKDECGRIELAGKSIAVPFVGMTAAALALAEALRLLHGGPRFQSLKARLGSLGERPAFDGTSYGATDLVGIGYAPAVTNGADD